jgi:hypothetical protein
MMKQTKMNQRGITLWGLSYILFTVIMIFVFILRLYPLYYEKYQYIGMLDAVAQRPDATSLTEKDAIKYFMRNVSVTNLTRFSESNLKDYMVLERSKTKGQPSVLHLKYEASNALFGDLELKMVFDRSVVMRGPGGGE